VDQPIGATVSDGGRQHLGCATLCGLVGGSLLSLASSGAGWLGWVWLVLGGALLLLGLGMLGFAVAVLLELTEAPRHGPCPGCGERLLLSHPDTRTLLHCSRCGEFFDYRPESRALYALTEDYVAETPTFEVQLSERFAWPPGCCVCGEPSTRALEVSGESSQTALNLALGAAGLAAGLVVVRAGGGTKYTVAVPHCHEHSEGVALDPRLGGLWIKFRSLKQQQAFRELNRGPGPAREPSG
jgi:hypothetical protein